MKNTALIVLLLSLTLVTVNAPAYAMLSSTFDSGTEGWTTVGATLPWWQDGYILAEDITAGAWYFKSPSTYSGDWTIYDGSNISFDIAKQYAAKSNIYILSGSNFLRYQTELLPAKTWVHVAFELNPINFLIQGDTYENILANVEALYIDGEGIDGKEWCALDNVKVGAAVPLPGGFLLLSSGLLRMIARGRRWKRG